MKSTLIAGFISLLLFTSLSRTCWAGRELTEEEMGLISAGSASAGIVDGVVRFQFSKTTLRMAVEGSGDITATENGLPGTYGIILRDNAQGNLSSFINLNAVNSNIQFLINLNVSINSNIGIIKQLNLPTGY